jgi:hypothetical protein
MCIAANIHPNIPMAITAHQTVRKDIITPTPRHTRRQQARCSLIIREIIVAAIGAVAVALEEITSTQTEAVIEGRTPRTVASGIRVVRDRELEVNIRMKAMDNTRALRPPRMPRKMIMTRRGNLWMSTKTLLDHPKTCKLRTLAKMERTGRIKCLLQQLVRHPPGLVRHQLRPRSLALLSKRRRNLPRQLLNQKYPRSSTRFLKSENPSRMKLGRGTYLLGMRQPNPRQLDQDMLSSISINLLLQDTALSRRP